MKPDGGGSCVRCALKQRSNTVQIRNSKISDFQDVFSIGSVSKRYLTLTLCIYSFNIICFICLMINYLSLSSLYRRVKHCMCSLHISA